MTQNSKVTSTHQRLVCVIPLSGYVEGHGWRVAFVKEGEAGYWMTGEWPCPPGGIMPWFWGHDLKAAQHVAHQQNEAMGIDAKTAAIIIAQSMIGATPREEG